MLKQIYLKIWQKEKLIIAYNVQSIMSNLIYLANRLDFTGQDVYLGRGYKGRGSRSVQRLTYNDILDATVKRCASRNRYTDNYKI